MKSILYTALAWASGITLGFVGIWLRFGFREAVQSLSASLLYSFMGFALTVVVLFLPALVGLKAFRGGVTPGLGAITCLVLSLVPVALINLLYSTDHSDIVNYENALLFLLLGVPGAIFGWLWAGESARVGARGA